MTQYIPKNTIVAEIEKSYNFHKKRGSKHDDSICDVLYYLLHRISTLEVKDSYEQTIQYPSIKDGIKAHAETYSFNIESLLFNQLMKEQQILWRKEIEQACISGGEVGVELARDTRYKENAEVKEVDLEKEIKEVQRNYKTIDEYEGYPCTIYADGIEWIAKHFFELGLRYNSSYVSTPNIDDTLKEIGVDPDSKSAKSFKESYYMALEKFKAQKGE